MRDDRQDRLGQPKADGGSPPSLRVDVASAPPQISQPQNFLTLKISPPPVSGHFSDHTELIFKKVVPKKLEIAMIRIADHHPGVFVMIRKGRMVAFCGPAKAIKNIQDF